MAKDPGAVLVTGAHGFIGARAVARLLAEGYGVRALVRRDAPVAGADTWPFVHIEDLLDVIVLALQRPEAVGRASTVVDGHTTWGAYAGTFATWLGTTLGRRDVRDVYDTFRGWFVTTRIEDELGYAPRTTFDDAMAETLAFLDARGLMAGGG